MAFIPVAVTSTSPLVGSSRSAASFADQACPNVFAVVVEAEGVASHAGLAMRAGDVKDRVIIRTVVASCTGGLTIERVARCTLGPAHACLASKPCFFDGELLAAGNRSHALGV